MTTAGRVAAGLLGAGVLVAAVVLARGALSAGAPPRAAAGAASPPRIVVEPRAFDFGTVLPGRTLHKEIAIRNHGGSDLVITDVKKTCNCTVVGAYAKVVEPGAATVLRVSLTTPDTPGRAFEGVRIESNDPDQPQVDVDVEATVVVPPPAR